MNIVRKIETIGVLDSNPSISDTNLVLIDTTGVGLPSGKGKIEVGESYTFLPSFNIPALAPNMEVTNLMKSTYLLKISIGRAHNYVVAILKRFITDSSFYNYVLDSYYDSNRYRGDS
uniref:Spore germination protein n=1 Tax=Heterorhabditis bacteriophora TaxID=37862 RepID=A0A1I7XUN3_HETBA